MAAKGDPTKFVRSIVCIPQPEYEELLSQCKERDNNGDPAQRSSRDHVFKNIARASKGFDQLRKERERDEERGEGDDSNEENEPSLNEDVTLVSSSKENFRDKLDSFGTNRLRPSFKMLVERILGEPRVYVRDDIIQTKNYSFPHTNFLDLAFTAVGQRKPSFLLNLDKFIDFLARINFPSHLIQNKYMRNALELRRRNPNAPILDDNNDDDDDDDDDDEAGLL